MQIKIFEFNMVCVNTYLIYDETKEAALIDCGAYTANECKQLAEYINFNQLKLKHLLNTHLHFDHVFGNRFIFDTYGLKPQYHELEASMPGLKTQATGYNIPIDYEPVTAEHFIKENDLILFGNSELKAILTPGHSPGSLSFYSEKGNCVFTGDALFKQSIGRTDLWKGNQSTLVNAIRKNLLTLPDKTVVYSGHGPASTVEEEKQLNPYIN